MYDTWKHLSGGRIPAERMIKYRCLARDSSHFRCMLKTDEQFLAAVKKNMQRHHPGLVEKVEDSFVNDLVDKLVDIRMSPFLFQRRRAMPGVGIIRHLVVERAPLTLADAGDYDVFFVKNDQRSPSEEEERVRKAIHAYQEAPDVVSQLDSGLQIVPRCRLESMPPPTWSWHCRVINLLRRSDRRERMRQVLDEIGIPFRFFDAIDPLCDASWFQRYNDEIGGTKISRGAYGLIQSNLMILREAMAEGWETLMLLEDDVCFHKDFRSRFALALQRVPSDWQMLYLGAKQYEKSSFQQSAHGFYNPTANTTGSHALFLRNTCFQLLYDLFQAHPTTPVDETMKLIRKGTYVLNPNLIITLCGDHTTSDIQTKDKNDREDYDFWHWDPQDYLIQ